MPPSNTNLTQTQSTGPVLEILLLYQGQFATRPRDEITEFFRTNSCTVQIRTVREGDPSSDNTALKEYVKCAAQYSTAIALLTPDDRSASTAGNLWFEIGYWLATHPRDSLLILVLDGFEWNDVHQDGTAGSPIPFTQIISNLWGCNYKKADKSEWLPAIYSFVEARQQKHAQRVSAVDDIENRTFHWLYDHFWRLKGRSIPDLPESSGCQSDPSTPCLFRQKALVLTAELVAMLRMQERTLQVQDILRSLAFHSNLLVQLSVTKAPPDYSNLREQNAISLKRDIENLDELLKVLKEPDDAWKVFLQKRIEHHFEHYYDLSGPPARRVPDRDLTCLPDKHGIPERVQQFFEWGETFRDLFRRRHDAYRLFLQGGIDAFDGKMVTIDNGTGTGQPAEIFWHALKDYAVLSQDLARLLSGWSLEFYLTCRDQLIAAMEDESSFHNIMADLVNALPHSSANAAPFARDYVNDPTIDEF